MPLQLHEGYFYSLSLNGSVGLVVAFSGVCRNLSVFVYQLPDIVSRNHRMNDFTPAPAVAAPDNAEPKTENE